MRHEFHNSPAALKITALRPRNSAGLLHTLTAIVLLTSGLWLAQDTDRWLWLAGQLLLAVAFLQFFVLLHEAGHDTLFANRRLNRVAGHLAGFVALIPFWCWQRIHRRHHRYTGWQDLDATTATLVPRNIGRGERLFINFAWASWLPLFVLSYRIQNYWLLPRIERYLPHPRDRRLVRINLAALVLGYAALLWFAGPATVLRTVWLGLLLSFMMQELLILSQHTHVPQRLSEGRVVRRFPPMEQAQFTRSLRLPRWLSALLMHFDAHELHHMHPSVPGYRLRELPDEPVHEVSWWRWVIAVKRLPGTDFLFSNWDRTGVRL